MMTDYRPTGQALIYPIQASGEAEAAAAVTHSIRKLDYPATIPGDKGDKIPLTVTTRTGGGGENVCYLQLYLKDQLLGEGKTVDSAGNPVPVPPGQQYDWNIKMTVHKDLPGGAKLPFTVKTGHIAEGDKVEDDSKSFTVSTEEEPTPWWQQPKIIAPVAAALVGAVGITYFAARKS